MIATTPLATAHTTTFWNELINDVVDALRQAAMRVTELIGDLAIWAERFDSVRQNPDMNNAATTLLIALRDWLNKKPGLLSALLAVVCGYLAKIL